MTFTFAVASLWLQSQIRLRQLIYFPNNTLTTNHQTKEEQKHKLYNCPVKTTLGIGITCFYAFWKIVGYLL